MRILVGILAFSALAFAGWGFLVESRKMTSSEFASISALNQHPQRFQHKRVIVKGYLSSTALPRIYSSRDYSLMVADSESIGIWDYSNASKLDDCLESFANVIGEFGKDPRSGEWGIVDVESVALFDLESTPISYDVCYVAEVQ